MVKVVSYKIEDPDSMVVKLKSHFYANWLKLKVNTRFLDQYQLRKFDFVFYVV